MRIASLSEFDRSSQEALLISAHAAEMAVFGRRHCRPIAKLRQCVRRNAESFFVAIERNCLIGQLDLWPLHASSYALIKCGERPEESLAAGDISDSHSRYWYAGTFIVSDHFRRNVLTNHLPQQQVAKLLIIAMHEHMKKNASVFPINLFVVGSTVAGQKVAMHWGMGRYSPNRKCRTPALDTRPRYFRDFQSLVELEELLYWTPNP